MPAKPDAPHVQVSIQLHCGQNTHELCKFEVSGPDALAKAEALCKVWPMIMNEWPRWVYSDGEMTVPIANSAGVHNRTVNRKNATGFSRAQQR